MTWTGAEAKSNRTPRARHLSGKKFATDPTQLKIVDLNHFALVSVD